MRGLATACVLAATAALIAGCSKAEDTTPPVGAIQVSLSRPKVALGSPVEVTYRFTVAQNAPNLGSRRVFVHFLDADEELMWTDDHEPPTPTTHTCAACSFSSRECASAYDVKSARCR